MNPIKVVNNAWTTEHFVDADRYTRVSRSRTLCGLKGTSVFQPDAVWFGAPKKCSKCFKKAKKAKVKL